MARKLPRGFRGPEAPRASREACRTVVGTSPFAASDGSRRAPHPEGPGTRLGHCQPLERIGEGGFGAVFLAEQEEPIALITGGMLLWKM